jgi:basic membrane protein A
MRRKVEGLALCFLALIFILTACEPPLPQAPTVPVVDSPVTTPSEEILPLATLTPISATESTSHLLVCQVTDTGGIDDKSFNAATWRGIRMAEEKFGVSGKYLVSKTDADYETNLNELIKEKCDLIISTGFLLSNATRSVAYVNPNQKFSIVDYSYDPVIPNILSQVFTTHEAAFLAGYLAAGMTKTGKIGTFGGFPIPTVTIFMDGLAQGVAYYNHGQVNLSTILVTSKRGQRRCRSCLMPVATSSCR